MPGDIGHRPPFSLPHERFRVPAAQPQPTAAKRLRPQASLASLYLATKQSQALQVPPHAVKTPLQGPNNHFYAHLVRATQVDAHLLSAQVPDFHNPDRFRTQYFILGDAIESSDVAVLRGMRTIDRDVSQIYVGKELFLEKDYRDELFGTGHRVRFDGMFPQALDAVARQVNVQAAVKHPMMPHFQLITHDTLYMMMPQMGANVTQVLSNIASERTHAHEGLLDVPVRLGLAYQTLRGVLGRLQELHALQVAHRDIKPENLTLRQDGDVYLIDYETASPAGEFPAAATEGGDTGKGSHAAQNRGPRAFGTEAFFAPEVALGVQPHDGRSADIWSLAVTLVVTLTGQNPIHVHSETWRRGWQAAVAEHKKNGRPPAPGPHIPAEVARTMAQLQACAPKVYPKLIAMLDPEPGLRPTARELVGWLEGHEQQVDHARELAPLLHELRLQSALGLMPVDNIVAQDKRLMQPSPGESAALRPTLRRANSENTLLRPFVSPFDRSPKNLAVAAFEQQDWKETPRFDAVQKFLYAEEEALFDHFTNHPEAAARLFAAEG